MPGKAVIPGLSKYATRETDPLYISYTVTRDFDRLSLGGCPRTATVARARLIESYFLVI